MIESEQVARWPVADHAGLRGAFRMHPKDFRVTELPLPIDRDETGEHLILEVEKTGLTTARVSSLLAQRAGCSEAEIGFAGTKDRHAVCVQSFSVRDPLGSLDATHFRDCAVGEAGSLRIASGRRASRKLRRGDLIGNRFELRVTLQSSADDDVLSSLAARIGRGGPNYFGSQRFGIHGGNLVQAQRWVEGARLPRRGSERGWILSSARAALFNDVLAARVRRGDACSMIDGDVLEEDSPTGPLWGRGRSAARDTAAAVENEALAAHRPWCERLEHAGLQQERRALWLRPKDITVHPDRTGGAPGLNLAFTLPPGTYATTVLRWLGTFEDASREAAAA